MTATVPTPQLRAEPDTVDAPTITGRAKKRLTSRWASLFALVIAALWTIPTFGLLLTSVRPEQSIKSSGWWTWFTNPEFTLDNYQETLFGRSELSTYFVNSIVITVPSVIIPVTVASLARTRSHG